MPVLAKVQMVPCPCCKGSKVQHFTVITSQPGEFERSTTTDMPCVWCKGTGEMTTDELAKFQRAQDIWCKCGNPSGQVSYHDDVIKGGKLVSKHHWTCDDCGKVTQIG